AVTRCFAENEPVLDDWADHRRGRSAFTSERITASQALGLREALVVPLTARGRQIGALSLVRAEGSPV
ncbi:diguanylate cyclase, partial [Streptomyces sp. SID8455]|nr:diguanylate cyclase [Streptomyces sp. SID8455]